MLKTLLGRAVGLGLRRGYGLAARNGLIPEDSRLITIDTTEILRSALSFYADQGNWSPREVPVESLPLAYQARAEEIQHSLECEECSAEGVEAKVIAMSSGPALDGGEHARFALWVSQNA